MASLGGPAQRDPYGSGLARESRQSRLTNDREPAPLAAELLDATAAEAGSSLDEAKAVNSKETEKATELRWTYSSSPAMRRSSPILPTTTSPELSPMRIEKLTPYWRLTSVE